MALELQQETCLIVLTFWIASFTYISCASSSALAIYIVIAISLTCRQGKAARLALFETTCWFSLFLLFSPCDEFTIALELQQETFLIQV